MFFPTGTTADTTVLTFTTGAGTAVADTAYIEIVITVRSLGSSAALVGTMTFMHNLSATGWLIIPTAVITESGTFNSTTARQFISLHMTSGASVVPTIKQCMLEVVNSSNP